MTASQRVLITGGASGLGRAMAESWLRDGARVLIGDVNEARGKETLAALADLPGTLEFIHLDVRDAASLNHVREWLEQHWGGLDVLVNNAGVAAAARIDRGDMADWDWIFDINVKGVVRGCKVFVPLMKRQGQGHIVNIASLAGLLNAPVMGSYNVTKAGVIALSETLRYELAPYGIHTTVVCPGFFRTNLHESMRTPEPGMIETVDKLLSSNELTAAQIADMIKKAVARRQFFLLPHKSGRRAYWFKRFLPPVFGRIMLKGADRMKRKLENAENA
ncbi:short chain dehydrogenase [Alcanivorax hongdengensis A-11-3]|uniref:Short chain dehydrogenase n=1 Tax=Alcanivorax hongdengensis A-11-3 TaxID=1177179 RepID=L0W944_9GAMM|nr:SDR family oxidoreductase [Alcanivorax hongdengensis]EKF73494.1 short chain dehydrogenase [Alcanivorax hongdengensis A-11-3]